MNYLYIGQEPYLKQKAIEELKSNLLPKAAYKMNFDIFHSEADNMADIMCSAHTMPFSSSQKIVVIKDINKLAKEDKKTLVDYLKKPTKFTTMVLDCDEMPYTDESFRAIAKLTKRVEFRHPKGKEVDRWISDRARSLNKRIEPDSIELVKKLIGEDDLRKLENELEKLSIYVGEKKDISKLDIERISGRSKNEDIFKLVDTINEKNAEKCFDIISDLVSRKTRPHEIIGLLAWHFRNTCDRHKAPLSVKSRLKRNIEILLDADIAVKRSSIDPVIILEFAVLKLCR